jgi:hypothetical protein
MGSSEGTPGNTGTDGYVPGPPERGPQRSSELEQSLGARQRSFGYDSLKRLGSANNPESGVVSYLYDNNGNMVNLVRRRDSRA